MSFRVCVFALFVVMAAPAVAHRDQEAMINEVDARLQRLQLLMDSQNIQEMYLRLEELDRENRELRGKVEELAYELKQAKDRERKLYLDMDQRLQRIEGGGVSSASSIGSVLGSDTPDYSQPSGLSAGGEGNVGAEEAQYRTAFNLLKDRRYSEAIAGFEAFLKAYPDSALAPNAQYWMAESSYVAGRYEQAARGFDRVRKQYASSAKAGDATLKLGFSYKALGRITEAKQVLNEVITRFPGSKASELAQDQLDKWSGAR